MRTLTMGSVITACTFYLRTEYNAGCKSLLMACRIVQQLLKTASPWAPSPEELLQLLFACSDARRSSHVDLWREYFATFLQLL